MGKIIDAAGEFFHHLADVHWLPLAIALGLQLARLLARVPAWRNIIRGAYPDLQIPRRTVLGSYLSGVGVNAILVRTAHEVSPRADDLWGVAAILDSQTT